MEAGGDFPLLGYLGSKGIKKPLPQLEKGVYQRRDLNSYRILSRGILSPLCLPIPPLWHWSYIIFSTVFGQEDFENLWARLYGFSAIPRHIMAMEIE